MSTDHTPPADRIANESTASPDVATRAGQNLTFTAVPLADRAALRDRIADVLAEADGWRWVTGGDKARSSTYRSYQSRADAVLAVLPEPADRAAVLREAADWLVAKYGVTNRAAGDLRRMADEAQQPAAQATQSNFEESPEDTARRFARRLFAVERVCSGRPGYHTITVKQLLTAMYEADDEPADRAAAYADAIASCPGYELSPNPCRCPCYGCKHHCGAHQPEPADRAACICGHSEQQHFEGVCIAEVTGCECGDFLPVEAAAEEIARLARGAEEHRLALSQALGLGTSAPWEAIHERVKELRRPAVETPQPDAHLEVPPGCHPQDCCGDPSAHVRRVAAGEQPTATGKQLPMLFWDEPAGVVHEDGRITAWLSRAVNLAQSVPGGQLVLRVEDAARLRRALTTALNDAAEEQPENETPVLDEPAAVPVPPATHATEGRLASLAVSAANALRDEKRHYRIACEENARLRATIARVRRLHDARVRALHQQYRFAGDDTTDYCAHCNQISGGWIPWPCDTIRALDGEQQPGGPCVAGEQQNETPEAEAWDVPDARPGTTDYTLTHPAAGVRQDGAPPQEADCNTGPGWYEVINPRNATTNIAYVHEDGSLYLPEGDALTQDEFAFAAARGKAHRLVRADEEPRP